MKNDKTTWDYEAQIAENVILPKIPKNKEVKVYVEADAMFLNIRMENVSGFVFQERHNHPDEATSASNAFAKYFEEKGIIPEKTEYGFCVVFKP